MSRHRNVRNLDIDDVMAEDEYDSEEDLDQIEGGGDFDMSELSEEDRAAMDEGVAHVYSVIGDDTSISLQTIQDTLWYYYFDKEETIDFLLDMIAKQKSAQVKETKVAAKGADINQAIKKKRRAHLATLPDNQKANGRPIPLSAQKPSSAKKSLGSFSQSRTGGSSLSSLRMKMAGQQSSATNRLAQLNRDKKPMEESNKEQEAKTVSVTRPSALSSLAQQSKSNSGSALQRLAARHKPEPSGAKEASSPNNTISSTSALAKLSQRHKDKPSSSSLSDLAKKSRQSSLQSSGLQALKQNQLSHVKANKPTETQDDTMQSTDTAHSIAMPVQTSDAGKPEIEAIQSHNEEFSYPDNPLCAAPSSVAQFLFTPLKENVETKHVSDYKTIGAAKSLTTTIQKLMPSSKNLTTFKFDSPSPDDIVHIAQSQRKIGASKTTQPKTTNKPAQTVPMTKKPSSQAKSIEEDVEFLEDDDDNQMDFDMAALNLGEKKPKTAKPKKASSMASTPASSQPSSPKASPLAKIPVSKRVDVEAEYAKRSSEKAKLNMVVIGHVDAGKSTLMGHFLYALGQVSDKTIQKYEREAQKIGKSSFAYAWVLDETGEERSRGITMDIATNHFETKSKQFTLLDAPGHRDFIPNMISGAAQADVAVLVVDATTGEFEAGFDANGQTKEHALLVRSLGVQQMIVAVNKLDVMDWSEARFEEIKAKLGTFLVQAGFRKSKLYFVPVSGLTGENLVARSADSALNNWYNGQTLVDHVDQFEPPLRPLDRPFRMAVSDFFKGGIGSSSGVSVAGRIDAGHVQVGEQVVAIPGGEIGIVKTMQVNDETASWGAAGDSCLMTLTGLDIMQLSSGSVLCTPSNVVPVTSHFEAQIVVFDIKVPITSGFPVILHHQSLNEPASVVKLIATIDKSSGEIIKKNPRHLSKGSTATVRIKLANRPIPLETFKDNKDLGRVMLRKGGETVAAGVVTQIISFGS